jgi:hypothetical protein
MTHPHISRSRDFATHTTLPSISHSLSLEVIFSCRTIGHGP